MHESAMEMAARQLALTPAACSHCGSGFLAAPAQLGAACPHCSLGQLAALPQAEAQIAGPPELVVPFALGDAAFDEAIVRFDRSFFFTPRDLQAATLRGRAKRVFLPMWLVDVSVQGQWQAEVGYDYEVVSHVERYENDGWRTNEVRETRIRWEPRAGTVEQRRYDNVRAPALEAHDRLVAPLGRLQMWQPQPYAPELIGDALVQLPTRPPADAWTAAEPTLMHLVEQDVQRAASGQHVRQFKWDVTFVQQVWTLLLLPTLMTYYKDDAGAVVPLLINGRSGETFGERRVSWQLVRRTVLLNGLLAVVLLAAAVLLSQSEQADAGALLMLAAAGVGLGALWPLIYATSVQRSERRRQIKL